MKKVLMSVVLFLGLAIPCFAELEAWDIQVDSYTYKKVQIDSTNYTLIMSTAEIWISTTSSPVGYNPLYKMIYWEARHDGTVPVCITDNNLQSVDQILPLKSNEIYREEQYKRPMYAKLQSTLTGSTTLYIVKGSKKIR